MDVQKLRSLISKGEGPKLDFKLELNIETGTGKKELAKDVSAIANSRGGRGYIIFGIEDKTKKVIGIDPEKFKEEQIQQVISTRCEPPIPISVEIEELEKKIIGIIIIYSSEQKPYQIRETGTFYIRRGSTTDIMRKEELAGLFQEIGLISYELTPIPKASIKSLNIEMVKAYTSKLGLCFDGSDFSIIEDLGIVTRDREDGEYHPTAGGLLLFGINPQLYIPHCFIRVVNKINNGYEEVKIFTGTLIDMLDKTEDYIKCVVDTPSYPVNAVFEAIANAAAYRDYLDIYHEITVLLLNKSCEVVSPGSLIKSSGGCINASVMPGRRNMWLYQRLLSLDDKGRFLQTGKGFKRMRQAFKGYGRVNLVNIEDKNMFKVIFPGIDKFK